MGGSLENFSAKHFTNLKSVFLKFGGNFCGLVGTYSKVYYMSGQQEDICKSNQKIAKYVRAKKQLFS